MGLSHDRSIDISGRNRSTAEITSDICNSAGNGTNLLTLSDAFVGASDTGTLTVIGGTLSDTIDATAVQTTHSVILEGSSGNDTFSFTAAGLTSSDTVSGGAGADTLDLTTAGTITAAQLANITGIDTIQLSGGGNVLTLTNAIVAASDSLQLTIDVAAGPCTVNAAAVTANAGIVIMDAGTGGNSRNYTGGAGANTFELNAAAITNATVITGGSGTDTLAIMTAGTIAASAFTHVSGIDILQLASGTTTNNLTLSDALVGAADTDTLTLTGGAGTAIITASSVAAGHSVIFDLGSRTDTLAGGAGNDTFDDNGGTNTFTGGGGSDTYNFGIGDGTLAINNAGTGTVASGQLDFGAGITEQDLWFTESGTNLVIDRIGSTDQITVDGWFGSNGSAELSEIKASDGLEINSQVNQLVAAMAAYSSNNTGFNLMTATQMPSDTTLQNAITAAWHH